MNAMVTPSHTSPFAGYTQHGWKLVPITPGLKAPTGKEWNRRENCITHPVAAGRLHAAGLCHAYNDPPTCAVDVDNIDAARTWLSERGMDLDALLTAPGAVLIRSPSPGRAKLLYTIPTPLPSKKLAEYVEDGKKRMALELRCGTADGRSAQDVLPPSPHPSGGYYEWAGDGLWTQLPPLPDKLYFLWASLAEQVTEHKAEPTIDRERIGALLDGLDPDMVRDDWYRVGMAIHHETGGSEEGFKLWHDWSSLGQKYQGEKDCRTVWSSFTPGGGITGQTLVQMQASAVDADDFPIVPITQREPMLEPNAQSLPIDSVLSLEPELKPVEYVIDGFLATGLTTIAGTEGVGKTSLIVPLAAAAAQLIQTDFLIELRRKIVYVAEDVSQVERALYGLWRHAPHRRAKWSEWREWFVLLPAKRVPPKVWGETIARLVERHSVEANGYRVGPLIVLDTANATLDVESENDNAEVGRAISCIKENLAGAACWLVTHVPKALSRKDVEDLVIRGANAWSADANATAYIFKDEKIAAPDIRFMLTRKVRFERQVQEIQFSTSVGYEQRPTLWGSEQSIAYRYGVPSKSSIEERKELAEQGVAERKAAEAEALREAILCFARERSSFTKAEARDSIRKNRTAVYTEIDRLTEDGLLTKVERASSRGGKPAQSYAIAERAKLETMTSSEPDMNDLLGVST